MSWRQISAFDEALCIRCNRISRFRPVSLFFKLVSRIGDGAFWYALMAVLPPVYGPVALAVVARMALAGMLGVLAYKWLKAKTLRPRPYQICPAVHAVAAPLDQFSFPSGHTLHAVSLSWVAAAYFPELGPLLFATAALIAASRPILGLHYPSDVAAGAAIGLGIGEFALRVS